VAAAPSSDQARVKRHKISKKSSHRAQAHNRRSAPARSSRR
jgi:hypothetical protein